MKKNIAILGSTGSIGTQTLDIIKDNRDQLSVYAITANNNYKLLIEQAIEFEPEIVVIANEKHYSIVKDALQSKPIKVWGGNQAIADAATMADVHIVITAMVGYSGLIPTLKAIEAGKVIGLANKETLVVAGELIIQKAVEFKSAIIPVDSEHSAIFQCLVGEVQNPEKIILTASGGPFRAFDRQALETVTVAQALKHPNWDMGAKVTIDSASLMNKGFEMIEAKWLFDMQPHQIDVLIHPQSIIHSMVQFHDGSIKAQLGIPDMRLPISYALGLTHRIPNQYPRLDFTQYQFTFEKPDTERFPNLRFAFECIDKGGNQPCALNAANEVAVKAFLEEKLSFRKMSDLIDRCLQINTFITHPSLEDYIETDRVIRQSAIEMIDKI